MKCYFCISVSSSSKTSFVYENLLTVALKSARKNTELELYALYDGDSQHNFARILSSFDVNIVKHKFSACDGLVKTFPPSYWRKISGKESIPDYRKLSGSFMRLDIPFLEKDDQFVLYTDIDVMFLQSPSLDHLSPPILAAGPEFERNTEKMKYFNARVLLMNIPAMQGICAQILNDINNGIRNRTNLYDQGYLNDYCYSSLTKLPLQLNWKPYWGYSDKAEIVHFHGMKPSGDMQSSGFAMSEGGYINCFSDNLTDVSGYVYYLLKFYEFLGQTDSNWIRKNLEDIFRIRYGKNRRLRALLENLLRG